MEKENLYRLIEGGSLENISVNDLKGVVDKYPYFQTARLIYTKKLQISDNEEYGEELSKTAILCADRRKLFYLIQPKEYEKFLDKQEDDQPKEKDRTETLLDSYFESFGNDKKKEPAVDTDTTGINYATTDYFAYLEALESEDSTDFHHQPLKHQDIIDDFINNSESDSMIIRPFSKDKDEGKKSAVEQPEKIDEENEFLTETLAKIYIKQKKYEQALTIIKRLSLTFPKKSSYFADQIRFLEYLIINEQTNK